MLVASSEKKTPPPPLQSNEEAAPVLRPEHLPSRTIIEPVRTAADRDRFIKLPFKIYAGDPCFVPPMVVERRDFLDPRKNPFLAHAELSLYLAVQNGEVVGRIAAINDLHYNQFHNTESGFFGMIECVNDLEVANALIDAAADWVRAKGMKQLLGPVNLSFNHDVGVLIDGFGHPPAMMLAYNPPYYQSLMEGCGLEKAQDLWSYHLSTAAPPPEK